MSLLAALATSGTRGRGGLGGAKACGRYVIHRPSDTATREYRTGFDAEFDRIEKTEVYDHLEAASGAYFHRLTLAPAKAAMSTPITMTGPGK